MPNTNKHEQLFGISYNRVNFKPYHTTNRLNPEVLSLFKGRVGWI